jgi:hypothetical protein
LPAGGIMFRISSLTVIFALITGSAAFAQFPAQPPPPKLPGTQQDRTACQPDVKKFCQQLVPPDPNAPVDPFAIASCLQANRSHISAACNAVLTGNGR